jgi:hypothetical protein
MTFVKAGGMAAEPLKVVFYNPYFGQPVGQ